MEIVSSNARPKLADQLKAESQDEKTVSSLLSKIIILEGDIRKVSTINEFGVLAVNESHKITPYFQSFFWRKSKFGKIEISAVSGASRVDKDAPSILTVIKIIKLLAEKFSGKGLAPFEATPDKVGFYEEWSELLPSNSLWCEFTDSEIKKKQSAGLLFFRETPFTTTDITALTPVLDAYRYSWFRLPQVQRESRSIVGSLTRSRIFKVMLFAAILGVMFMPVRESVLADATIIPRDPKIVSVPIAGVVNAFFVRPNQAVKKGDLLFSLDDREIRNEVAVATQELETARAEYLRSAQKSFSDDESKAELELQKARVAQRVLRKEFAESQLAQTSVYASRDGVAVFNDENEWIGKPVSVGEKIVTLANPQEKEVGVYMPVDDALSLLPGAEMRLFLNADPTKPLKGRLTQTSYEPTERGEGLSYYLKASIEDEDDFSRLGWQGTAKVYSNEEVRLFYYLFRKPISSVRQLFGF